MGSFKPDCTSLRLSQIFVVWALFHGWSVCHICDLVNGEQAEGKLEAAIRSKSSKIDANGGSNE